MGKDLKVKLENRPGTLAALGEVLGKAGVNIEGMCGPCEGDKVVHVLVDDVKTAKAALKEAGIEVLGKSDVLVLDVNDEPGVLGGICRRLSDAGVNINFFYVATGTRIVLGVDGLQRKSGDEDEFVRSIQEGEPRLIRVLFPEDVRRGRSGSR
jgi:hypothetical protein